MNRYVILWISLLIIFNSCKEYLEVKPSSDITQISTEDDIKNLLSYTLTLNRTEPGIVELVADDYLLTDQAWSALTNENDRKVYLWENTPMDLSQWTGNYNAIFYSNTILDHIDKVKFQNKSNYYRYKGMALFHRSRCYYRILQTYSRAYNPVNADIDQGFILRLSSDINEKSVRLNMKDSYDYLVKDLKESSVLLSVEENQAAYPTKSAAFSLLANLYLDLQTYDDAFKMADSAIFYNPRVLLDFRKDVPLSSTIPFNRNNKEIIFYSILNGSQAIAPTRAKITAKLIETYQEGDLRLNLFFQRAVDGTYTFKGNYDGNITSAYMFSGITVAELLLQRAECAARTNRVDLALDDLNKLREFRIADAHYAPIKILDTSILIDEIFRERRREMVFRGRRWHDLRRLASEGRATDDLSRTIKGSTYVMTPVLIKELAFKMPSSVITNSGIEQNK